ncbi:MAG: tetratricopeptide repeat protein [Desulfovibrionaceae bacterium]
MQLQDLIPIYQKEDSSLPYSEGVLLWISNAKIDTASFSSLINYGGLPIKHEGTNLTFFFESINTVPFSLLHQISISKQSDFISFILPASLYVDHVHKKHIHYSSTISFEEKNDSQKNTLFIHSSLTRHFLPQQGITLDISNNTVWASLIVERSCPLMRPPQWSFFVFPSPNIAKEKEASSAWQITLRTFEKYFREYNIRYSIHNNYSLQITFDTFLVSKNFLNLYKTISDSVYDEMDSTTYLPQFTTLSPHKTFNFNTTSMDSVFSFNRSKAVSGHLHTTLFTALILEYSYIEIDSSQKHSTLFKWVALLNPEEIMTSDIIMLVPQRKIASYDTECFYCGRSDHSITECPTIQIENTPQRAIFQKFSTYSFEELLSTANKANDILTGKNVKEIISLYNKSTEEGFFVQALLSITKDCQLRTIPYLFLSKEKSSKQTKLLTSSNKIYQLYKKIVARNLYQTEKEIELFRSQHKDYRYASLLGFIALEKGNYSQALEYWKEAENLSFTIHLISWHIYLQARLHEIQEKYFTAHSLYRKASKIHPTWYEAHYRSIITLIKLGKSHEAMGLLKQHIVTVPEDFIRILMDQNAEQAKLEIIQTLTNIWQEYSIQVEEIYNNRKEREQELILWSSADPSRYSHLLDTLNMLLEEKEKKNFLLYANIISAYQEYLYTIENTYKEDIEKIRYKTERLNLKLTAIEEHSKWTPLQKYFPSFYTQYNESKAFLSHIPELELFEAKDFSTANKYLTQVEQNIIDMERALHFILAIRDSSLFLIMFGKSLIFWEILMTILVFVGTPILLHYSLEMGLIRMSKFSFEEQWALQKNLIFIGSIAVLFIVSSVSSARFKKHKENILKAFGREIQQNIFTVKK